LRSPLFGNICKVGGTPLLFLCYVLRRGRDACSAPLLNKEKLEEAVPAQIQEQILSEENVRKYISLVLEQAQQSTTKPSAGETAVEMALRDVEALGGNSGMGFYPLRIAQLALKSFSGSVKPFLNARSNCTRKLGLGREFYRSRFG
jgi:hypothetical protein